MTLKRFPADLNSEPPGPVALMVAPEPEMAKLGSTSSCSVVLLKAVLRVTSKGTAASNSPPVIDTLKSNPTLGSMRASPVRHRVVNISLTLRSTIFHTGDEES